MVTSREPKHQTFHSGTDEIALYSMKESRLGVWVMQSAFYFLCFFIWQRLFHVNASHYVHCVLEERTTSFDNLKMNMNEFTSIHAQSANFQPAPHTEASK